MRNSFKNVTHIRQLFLILFISTTHTITLCRAHQLGNKTDHDALLAIKSQLLDHSPAGVFDSWNHSLHHCSWDGVTCGSKHNRVVILDLSSRSLVGTVSPFIGNLSFLKDVELYDNSLVGHIPPEFGRLLRLQILRLSNNKINGEIPSNLSACINLQELSVGSNRLEGKIPLKLRALSNLKVLSVHINNFSGNLFDIITNMTSLDAISATYNSFTGHIPTNIGSTKDALMKVSYDMLLKATNGFSQENLVGVGTFGYVFRGILDGENVAVKVLNLQIRGASKSFMAECKALRNVRHRNLVGIMTACSSTDHQRNDFKALVYEFMPNGSLDERLHGNRVENITLLQRLDIAIDVAHALSYLHHDCEVPIVHCDLKPTNVLLDVDMVARVGDFGLAKFLPNSQHPNQSSSIGVRGTIGYAAPEYGLGSEPCTDGDVYSYGILVLELMTGKRPTDSMFQEDYNLNTYTEAAFPDNVLEIVDQTLLEDNTETNEVDAYDIRATQASNQRRYECVVDVISVGIACSKHVPRDRMKIKEAISKLQAARGNLCNERRNYITRG